MDHKAVKFCEFNPKIDIWDNYIDRLKFCFEANGIMLDGAKRANFFTVCGAEVFETFLALITPRKASDVTFNEIEVILTKHYSPKPNEISMSYKFYTRNQNVDENASDYIAQLRKISSSCNFMDLERMLRDRIVCGMKDHRLQYELLKRDNLCYQDVVDAILSSESAGKDCRIIQNIVTEPKTYLNHDGEPSQLSKSEPMDINSVQQKSNMRLCYRCGGRHGGECRFINAICRYCKKKGHIEKICTLKKKTFKNNINFTEDQVDAYLNGIYSVQMQNNTPCFVLQLLLEDVPVTFQVDTGASFSLINEHTWGKIQRQNQYLILKPSLLTLRTWTDAPVMLLGQAQIQVKYENIICNLSIIIAKGRGPNLIGRDWLDPLNIRLNINCLSGTDHDKYIRKIIAKYTDIFKEGLGTYCGSPVSIHLKHGSTPKFLKARPVPYAIKGNVEKEIDRLVAEGVLRPISYSDWATPIVPILKKSGEIRLCGDYRSTVNQATESDTYPMPTANEVFAIVAGAKFFSTLDLDRAYTQVRVNESTAKLLTLNTCKGLYTVHRLPFGVKACPGIFQRLMTALLAGIPGVAVLIDDIIISGPTLLTMQQRLEMVLDRIQKSGLRLNKKKCRFAQEQIEFLGFVINEEGVHPASSKIEAIIKTPEPRNVQELQAFLGLYNFYERFIPHKATVLEPLHRLLDKSRKWQWTSTEQNSFDMAKRLLTFETTLVHYDLHRPLMLICDSSQYGVGAVLSHVMDDGQERPVAMSSRTLHTHERRYSQLDKEATAIMFGIQKFHNYLAGRSFTVVTDHKPLLGIFNPKKPMPVMLSPRLTRIAIALTSHDYDIVYRPGSQIGNADSLSRWPQPVPDILKMLHSTHNGIVHTKSLARSYVWWPHLDDDINKLVSNCRNCLENRNMPSKTRHEWVTPPRPWSRIHMDFAGPFLNKTFLIIVDAFSRWPEVIPVFNISSATVIRHLRMLFATHGLCETLVTDNGTSFLSKDMETFLSSNKIKHITTAPYHPSTNGLAERMVQTIKNKLKKIDGSWDIKIPNMLLGLRVTPCTSNNKSPSELLMNRRLRTLLDNIHPDYLLHRRTEDQLQKANEKRNRETSIGHKVMYRNYNEGSKWLPGQIINKDGPSSYRVKTDDGAIVRRHIDQIIKLKNVNETRDDNNDISDDIQREETVNLEDELTVTNDRTSSSETENDMMNEEESDNITEIPSSEQWEEMLGIPSSSEITMSGGKIKNKLNLHSKVPYSRPSCSKFNNSYIC